MGNNLGGHMGRAIDMENAVQKLERRFKIFEDALFKVIGVVDSMQDKAQTTTHIDLHEEEAIEEKPKAKKTKKRSKAAA